MGPQVQLSDFVGEYGAYQFFLTAVLFIRYVFLGLMANSGPLMTPDVTFYCQLPFEEVAAIMPNITMLNKTEQELEIKEEFKRICQLDLHLYQQAYLNTSQMLPANGPSRKKFNTTDKIRECPDFTYEIAPDQGRTMTSEFDLVCDRDWLRSMFQSMISAAIVVAHVFWGTFSDKFGRFKAQKLCLLVSLLAGGVSIFAVDFLTFVTARALCSFGDLGVVVSLTTTVVELVGNQYRGISVAMVNFGYALGVTILPYIVAYFEDFRKVVAFTVMCHISTMPFIFVTNESVRWLLTNRKFKSAKRELKRIRRWNKRSTFCCFAAIRRPSAEPAPTTNIGHIVSGDGQKQEISISHQDKKLAFELMFKQFVDHIESQNLCDPHGSGNRCESNPSPTSQSEENSATPDPPTITTTFADSPPAILKQPSVAIEDGNKYLSTSNQIIGENNTTLLGPKARKLSTSSLSFKYPAVGNELFGRATSCSLISGSLPLNPGFLLDPKTRAKDGNRSLADDMIISLPETRADAETWFVGRKPTKPPDCNCKLVASQLSFVGRVNRLFRDKQLMIAVFTIVWTTFNSELQYTSFIIINLEVGEDVYLNYILGGCMEALAAIIASILLSYAPRRHTLITFWLLISLSCFGLSIAHIDSTWAVWLLALAKFSQSCLSSVASVAAYESFPTFLRQSGSGLVFTLGMLGSVFAPLIFAEFDDQVGMDRVLMTFSLSSLTAAILIYIYLKETRNCELQ